MKRFGKSWGAPVCKELPIVETPVGWPCLQCERPIADGDQGVIQPFMPAEGGAREIAMHLDCFLDQILSHGPDCPRCRGLERNEHKLSCAYAKHGGDCDCPRGKETQRLLDPKTTLAELDNIAESMGVDRARVNEVVDRMMARRPLRLKKP